MWKEEVLHLSKKACCWPLTALMMTPNSPPSATVAFRSTTTFTRARRILLRQQKFSTRLAFAVVGLRSSPLLLLLVYTAFAG